MPAEGAQKANSSNLYLVTFLATLFLLLFVSCTIVLRSYLLRRRYQRQVEQALAQGIVLTPRTPGSRKKRYGVRPRLYENWIAPLHVSGISGCQLPPAEKECELLGGRWIDMLPLTVQTVVVKRRTRESLLSPTCSPLTAQSPEGHPLLTGVRFASPDADSQPQGMLGSLFSRFSRPSPPPTQVQVTFPRPSGSETPTNAATPRERRESQANWRTIVTPSPSLAMAGAVDAVSATARVRSSSTPGDRRSRRMSMPASPPTALPSSNSQNNTGTSTPNGTSSGLFSAFRGRRNSTIAATSSRPVPPLPQPPPQSERDAVLAITRALVIVPEPPSSTTPAPAPAPTNRTRARININTNVPNPSTTTSAPSPGGGMVSAITPTLMTAVTPVVTSAVSPTMQGGPGQLSKSRIRTEMLQISVLVAMPDMRTSRLYGDAGVVKKAAKPSEGKREGGEKGESGHRKTKRRKEAYDEDEEVEDDSSVVSSSSSDEEDNDIEDEDEEDAPLPELVLGVTRLTYRHGTTLPTPTSPVGPPAFVIPANPPPPPPPAAIAALERQRERAASIRQLTHA